MTNQEKFEYWYKQSPSWGGDQEYSKEIAFDAWQAAIESVVVELPTACTFANDYYDAEELRQALDVAGVKYK